MNNETGNYTLRISTLGLTAGNRYVLVVNISYYSSNPGPYNYTILTLDFYYNNIPSGTTNGGTNGGGGGGGGGGTTIITPPPNVIFGIPVEQFILLMTIIGISIVATGGSLVTYYKVVKPRRKVKERLLYEIKSGFNDAAQLNHVLVLYRNTGMCIYFKSLGREIIDPELISGFLSAVSSFGKEVESKETLDQIAYEDKTIILADGQYTRVALVLGDIPSEALKDKLERFVKAFEKRYESSLIDWRGRLNLFRDAGDLVDDILETSFILPHKISNETTDPKTLKDSRLKGLVSSAEHLMKEENRDIFWLAKLLRENESEDRDELLKIIKDLRELKVFVPVSIEIAEKGTSEGDLIALEQKVNEIEDLTSQEKERIFSDLKEIPLQDREAYLISFTRQQELPSIIFNLNSAIPRAG